MSFFAAVGAAPALTVVTVLGVATGGVVTGWVLATVGEGPGIVLAVPLAAGAPTAGVVAAPGVAFTGVGTGRPAVAAGFFDAMEPPADAVATTGPGVVVADGPPTAPAVRMVAGCVPAAGVADAHGSAPGAAEGCGAFLCLKSDVMLETVDVAAATVDPACPAAF